MRRVSRGGLGLAATLSGFAILLVMAIGAQPAWAKADGRLADRFFFALYGGTSISSAGQIALTDNGTSVSAHNQRGFGPLFGLEVSFWPCDYAAIAISGQLFTVPSPATQYTALTSDLGLELLVALPLRYVQPYAGIWGGLRTSWVAQQGSGVLLEVRPVAGLNFYVNRNLRLFAQWQYVTMNYDVTSDSAHVTYADASTHLVAAGLRWSPDFFHAARGAMKFDLVWWSALLTIAAWGVGSWVGSTR